MLAMAHSQCAPEQIRLSLTASEDGTEMGVSWATPSACVGDARRAGVGCATPGHVYG